MIRPRNHVDALWAVERACKSGACSSVLAWLDERKLNFKDTQRLQMAAKQGNTLACLFRPHTTQTSMAELRLRVDHLSHGQLQLGIVKRRGGWPIEKLTLPLSQQIHRLNLQHELHTPAAVKQQLRDWQKLIENVQTGTQRPDGQLTDTQPTEPGTVVNSPAVPAPRPSANPQPAVH